MKQKIVIKNFGPIEDVEMEINDFAIFIGPQASEKSTIAKSVFFFLSLRDDLITIISKALDTNKFENTLKQLEEHTRLKFFSSLSNSSSYNQNLYLQFWYTEDTYISIEYKHLIKHHSKTLNITISEIFSRNIINVIHFIQEKSSILNGTNDTFLTSKDLALKKSRRINIIEDLQNRISNIFGFDGDLLFIPAGRSILALLSEQMQSINIKDFDYLLQMFIERTNSLKQIIIDSDDLLNPDFPDDSLDLIKELSQSILKGSYFNDDEYVDQIRIDNETYIKLLFASSGQQEAVWIVQMILLLILNKQKVFIVIEEPEAHLFPEAQKNMIDLIALLANQNGNQVFITTHSPYLLTSVNNLIYAYQVGEKHPEKVSDIIDKQLWLNPEKIKAYFVGGKENKGRIRDIIDEELEIIRVEEIDTASRINNDKFDQLFDLV
eukprot:GDKJ01041970.1.p1 GENE.GDKJ01041970.1~~GDKJ01041970.1.p1  ORF type:complete len:436 (-),score=52.41 GDKJ01041970.1:414-1721(-)